MEKDRHRAICQFCDTDFVGTDGDGGGKFATADDLADAVESHWPSERGEHRFVVCTGGEPLLQLDEAATRALHERGFEIAVETNGTRPAPAGIDWLCVSPKIGAGLALTSGDELKLVYPQAGGDPAQFEHLDFRHFRLQPLDSADQEANTRAALEYCLKNPQWSLSLQTHKYIGIR
ncbi:Queuosine Biosynthesis QueE Radical SAM [Actinokineospora spheciospongiae]|uniref:Queuosine Biosynthesis QueE Radical SAM n=2 Tax=Actinokineospora spheciospongiae TaxID=909613 RepID=W7IWI7_9PSEU|nr:Queuosine Biosynthesis QueE Radical SAM [Actinokineospora spheciospongiae]